MNTKGESDLKKFVSDFRYLAWGLTYLFVLFALLPTGESVGKIRFLDKFLHFLGFYFMVFSFIEGYGREKRLKFFLFALLLGSSIEGIQAFLPWRSADYMDLLSNGLGAFFAYITPSTIGKFIIYLIATMGGIGEIPIGPATIASLVTLVLYYFSPFRRDFLTIFLPVLFVLGTFVSSKMVSLYNTRDPKKVVVDEVFGVLFSIYFFPKTVGVLVIGFLLFRFFDIKKPFPVRLMEKLPMGLGVMMDDLIAALYTSLGLYFISLIDKIFPFRLF